MTITIQLSDRIQRVFERIAVAVESIDQTLKTSDDFTDEDTAVTATTHAVNEARERIPHAEPNN